MSTTLPVDPPPVATAPPASRASWTGQLRLGSCCVPVKAYPTISSSSGVALRQLHAGCGEHIEYHKCCPKHGRVQADQIVKGYPYSAQQCVALTEEDLATLEPTDDKTIHLEHFLSPTEFDLTLLAGRSLYLAPAHPAAMKPFVVIRQALLRADKWALGRTVFSSKRQLVIVYPADEVLLVQTLFDPASRRWPLHGQRRSRSHRHRAANARQRSGMAAPSSCSPFQGSRPCPQTLATKSSPRFTSGGARRDRFCWCRAHDKDGRSDAKANWKAQRLRSWWRVRWWLTSRSSR